MDSLQLFTHCGDLSAILYLLSSIKIGASFKTLKLLDRFVSKLHNYYCVDETKCNQNKNNVIRNNANSALSEHAKETSHKLKWTFKTLPLYVMRRTI